jgi:hsp70-interacting protein
MEHFSQDVVKRMQEIKRVLDGGPIATTAGGDDATTTTTPEPHHHPPRPPAGEAHPPDGPSPSPSDPHAVPATLPAQVALLDELVEIVESIDHARDLALIGGLPTLLNLLSSPHAELRARAAEVLGTAAQANPPVQDWFLEGGALPAVLGMLGDGKSGGGGDPCPLARQKALFALSCLTRHCDKAVDVLVKDGGGVALLVGEATGEAAAGRPGVARKAWQLLSYLATERPAAVAAAASVSGAGPALATAIALPGGDPHVRGAAIRAARALGEAGAGEVGRDGGLVAALQAVAGSGGGGGGGGEEGGDEAAEAAAEAAAALAALERAAAAPAGRGGSGALIVPSA